MCFLDNLLIVLQLIKGGSLSCRYLHFDFHQICGHIHFERLSILYEQIEGFLEKNGYDSLYISIYVILKSE